MYNFYFFLFTDIEMRLGYLGRLGDMNVNGHLGNFPDILHRPTHALSQPAVPNSQAGTYSWLFQGDLPMTMAHPGNSVGMDTKTPKKENEDIDVMSTDSSSSSSSDSQ